MMRGDSYLFGCVGPFAVLLPAGLVDQVLIAEDTGGSSERPSLIDLRALFATDMLPRPCVVRLRGQVDKGHAIVLDRVGQIHLIGDLEFLPLPSSFSYAAKIFDAVCSQPIEGLHGLRMRDHPTFMPIGKHVPSSGPLEIDPSRFTDPLGRIENLQ